MISFLCGSLTLLNISQNGLSINNVQAQSTRNETVKTDKVKDSNLMATLSMTAIGLLTSRLWSCTKTADMMVAAAGGAAFIAGEVIATIKLKKVMKDIETSITRDKKGNINNEQKMALSRLRQSYIEAREGAETKKTLQQLAAVAFAAAAATAYMLNNAEITAFNTCQSGISTAGAACLGLQPNAISTSTGLQALQAGRFIPQPSMTGYTKQTTQEVAEKAAEASQAAAAGTLVTQHTATCSLPYGAGVWACPFIETCAAAPAKVTAACTAVTPTLKASTGFCPAPITLGLNTPSSDSTKYFASNSVHATLINLIAYSLTPKKAHADLFSPLGIASSVAITYLLATSKTLGFKLDMYLLAPMNRAIIWGVLAGMVFMATSATDNVIGQINSNIQKIDAILFEYDKLKYGAEGSNTGSIKTAINNVTPGKLTTSAVKYDDIDLEADGNKSRLPCFTGPDPKSCPSFEESQKDLVNNNLFDKNTQQQMSSILKAANAFNGKTKISGAAISDAARASKNANAIQEFNKNARKNLMEKLKADGSKQNLDKIEKDFSDAINGAVVKNLKGKSSSDMLASIFGGSGGIPSLSNDQSSEKVTDKTTPDSQIAPVAAIDLGNTGTLAPAMEGLPADDSAITAEETKEFNEATKDAVSMDEFEIKNDITKNTDTNIFDLITNRYQKSGYPRLFKAKEVKEVKVDEQPVKK